MTGRPKSDRAPLIPMGQEGFDPSDDRHGKRSSYTNRGCRCEPCTAAKDVKPRKIKHGTIAGYNGHIALGQDPCPSCEEAGLKVYLKYRTRVRPILVPLRDRVVPRTDRFFDWGLTDSDREALDQGTCRTLDQAQKDLFTSPEKSDQQKAKKICTSCPVQGSCLQIALTHPSLRDAGQGTWGGATAEERALEVQRLRNGSLDHPLNSRLLPENKS